LLTLCFATKNDRHEKNSARIFSKISSTHNIMHSKKKDIHENIFFCLFVVNEDPKNVPKEHFFLFNINKRKTFFALPARF
jgi:hypothetical protein